MTSRTSTIETRKGFTLVELAVVIVVIGVLAALGVPKFLNSVESAKASEAIAYLSAVQVAQERYIAREGNYATRPAVLDLPINAPPSFQAGPIVVVETGTSPIWSMTMTRLESSSPKGAYTVTFNQNGFDPTQSTVMTVPEINPFGGYPARRAAGD